MPAHLTGLSVAACICSDASRPQANTPPVEASVAPQAAGAMEVEDTAVLSTALIGSAFTGKIVYEEISGEDCRCWARCVSRALECSEEEVYGQIEKALDQITDPGILSVLLLKATNLTAKSSEKDVERAKEAFKKSANFRQRKWGGTDEMMLLSFSFSGRLAFCTLQDKGGFSYIHFGSKATVAKSASVKPTFEIALHHCSYSGRPEDAPNHWNLLAYHDENAKEPNYQRNVEHESDAEQECRREALLRCVHERTISQHLLLGAGAATTDAADASKSLLSPDRKLSGAIAAPPSLAASEKEEEEEEQEEQEEEEEKEMGPSAMEAGDGDAQVGALLAASSRLPLLMSQWQQLRLAKLLKQKFKGSFLQAMRNGAPYRFIKHMVRAVQCSTQRLCLVLYCLLIFYNVVLLLSVCSGHGHRWRRRRSHPAHCGSSPTCAYGI